MYKGLLVSCPDPKCAPVKKGLGTRLGPSLLFNTVSDEKLGEGLMNEAIQ